MAEISDGGSRTDAARIGGVTLQSNRDWVLRFNAHGAARLIDINAPGPTPKLNDWQRLALKEIVEVGPIPAVHGVVRWRLIDPKQWLYEELAISLDETTVGRELNAISFRKFSARPRLTRTTSSPWRLLMELPGRDRSDPRAYGTGRRDQALVPGW